MRYFLLFLAVLLINFGVGGTDNTPKQELQTVSVSQNESFFTRLSNAMKKESNLLTGAKGLGKPVTTPFGQFRLISCFGGIKKNKAFLMLQGQLDSHWRLKKPILPPTQNDSILSEKILYPVNRLSDKKTLDYEKDVYIALLYDINPKAETFFVQKEIPLEACLTKKCVSQTITVDLSLARDTTYQTDVCPLMLNQLKNIPRPPTLDKLTAELVQLDEKHLELVVLFADKINQLDLQIDNIADWQIIKKDFNGQTAHFLIEVLSELPTEKTVEIKLLPPVGVYELSLPLKEGSYIPMPKNLSYWHVVTDGLAIFFLSPLFLVFLLLKGDKKQLNQQIKNVFLGLLGIGLFCLLLIYCYKDFILFFEMGIWQWIIGFLALVLALFYPKIGATTAVLCFFVWPKPYLLQTLYNLNTASFQPVIVVAIWILVAFIPFWIFKNMPLLFESLKKVKQYPYLIRLPQMMLLAWCLLVFIGGFLFVNNSVKDFNRLKNEAKPLFVSVENGYSLTSLINKIMVRLAKKDVQVISLKTNSSDTKTFLTQNHFPQTTFGLLYGPKLPYPVLIDGYVSFEKWGTYLKEVLPTLNKKE